MGGGMRRPRRSRSQRPRLAKRTGRPPSFPRLTISRSTSLRASSSRGPKAASLISPPAAHARTCTPRTCQVGQQQRVCTRAARLPDLPTCSRWRCSFFSSFFIS